MCCSWAVCKLLNPPQAEYFSDLPLNTDHRLPASLQRCTVYIIKDGMMCCKRELKYNCTPNLKWMCSQRYLCGHGHMQFHIPTRALTRVHADNSLQLPSSLSSNCCLQGDRCLDNGAPVSWQAPFTTTVIT